MPLLYEDSIGIGTKRTYPVLLSLSDVQPVTITPYGTPRNGKIIAIRIQDIARQKWFNWDNGAWDSNGEPQVTPGAGNLYVAFSFVNQGSQGGDFAAFIKSPTGAIYAQRTISVAGGATNGIEWTGDMPASAFALQCYVSP